MSAFGIWLGSAMGLDALPIGQDETGAPILADSDGVQTLVDNTTFFMGAGTPEHNHTGERGES